MANLRIGVTVVEAPMDDPGDTSINVGNVGTEFTLKIKVQDVRDPGEVPMGVIALPLDISWDKAFVEFIGNPNAADQSNPIVTSNFPLQRGVNFNPDSPPNLQGLRGAALPNGGQGAAIGILGEQEFSELRFRTRAATPTNGTLFTIRLAGSMSFADADALEEVVRGSNTMTIDPITVQTQLTISDTPGNSSLSGFVYIDSDNDGVRDTPTELGIPNVTINLFRQNETAPFKMFSTGANGFYHFEDLAPGTYRITESQPVCFLDGRETLGIGIPPPRNGTVGQDEFLNIQLLAGEHGFDYLFGELGLAPGCINKRMFLTSSPTNREIVAQAAGIRAATVRGTPGNDNIGIINDGQTIQVSVNNGPPTEFPISQVKLVTVDALGGEDTVRINGTAEQELACLEPTYATLRRDSLPLNAALGYAVEVLSAERITVDPGSGNNELAILRDSPQNDALVAAGNTATLNWFNGTLTGRARNFDKVRAISIASLTDIDTVDEDAHNYVLELLGNWQPI